MVGARPSITRVGEKPGRAWGIASLIAVAIPIPFLLTLVVLSVVIRTTGGGGGEGIVYGILAALGLLFFPPAYLIATGLAIAAVTRPRPLGRLLGWVTIAIVVLSIPAAWIAYLVWITPSRVVILG